MPLDREVDVAPGDIVLRGDPAPLKGAQPPIFGPYLLWPNGWMDEGTIWYGGRPRPRRHCVNMDSATLERGTAPPTFRPISIVAKWLEG